MTNPRFDIGSVLADKYRLERRLGSGAAGEVWKAENVLVGRTVAVKLLHPHLAADSATRTRFLTEARSAARIAHVNVVDVFDVGVSREEIPFIVMELCEGETLGAMIESRGALGVSYAADVVVQVLAALHAAHGLGIVHRDLKPDNVMVVHPRPHRPVAKVLDFGLAQCAVEPGTAEKELAGAIVGTPAYMPPEQALGELVDARADVYAAGAMLYEVLTGTEPFSGATPVEILAKVLVERPAPPSHIVSGIPPALDALVLSALAKEPESRPARARDFLEALLPFTSSGRMPSFLPPLESEAPVPLVEPRRNRKKLELAVELSSWPVPLRKSK